LVCDPLKRTEFCHPEEAFRPTRDLLFAGFSRRRAAAQKTLPFQMGALDAALKRRSTTRRSDGRINSLIESWAEPKPRCSINLFPIARMIAAPILRQARSHVTPPSRF
jgi:hypothetical protein